MPSRIEPSSTRLAGNSGTSSGWGKTAAGLTRKAAIDWRTVRGLLLAWLVTVPCAAALGMLAYVAIGWSA